MDLKILLLKIKTLPKIAGITKLIAQITNVALKIPIWLSDSKPIMVRATAYLMPKSARAILGINVMVKKVRGIRTKPVYKSRFTPKASKSKKS